ncbi:RAD protein (Pv-fam-e) [Plasmodium vivax]|uniref:RAD protein (Pv-fam-e) n=1 Tax=Plasmodium vivax (strain Salvador I) TaxID=126793 RepID=A5K5Z5_PLAVS|nr:RAD protein (Pv-fam-e) [Plasmodium vivax]EDL45330.1 RAD protein (Pv-fam-e) [Plasmodium vivax]|eukprot:XP_001615057.1 RAD protein (Pv-fam-e) [Plasmodium vivax Sal-1]
MIKFNLLRLTAILLLSFQSSLWKSKAWRLPKLQLSRYLKDFSDWTLHGRNIFFKRNVSEYQNWQKGVKGEERMLAGKEEEKQKRQKVERKIKRKRSNETKKVNQEGKEKDPKRVIQGTPKKGKITEKKEEANEGEDAKCINKYKAEDKAKDEENQDGDLKLGEGEIRSSKKPNAVSHRLPFECEELHIPEGLNINQAMKRIHSVHFIFISQKKACTIFCCHCKYKKEMFHHMVDEIWEAYKETALKERVPEEIQVKLWMGCKDELMDDVEYMEQISKKHLYPIVKKNVIVRRNFDEFVKRFNIWWDATMEKKKNLWMALLKEKIESYKSESMPT